MGSDQSNSPDSRIEELCQQFRQQPRGSDRSGIASFLQQVDSGSRPPLLERLVAIDIELRIAAGHRVLAEDYAQLGEAAVRIAGDSLQKNIAQLIPAPAAATKQAVEAKGTSDAATTPRVIGPYKLLQEIGEGGMGSVWMAEQERPVRRRVALKVIKAGMDSKQVIARFEAERQALAMMEHENIAKVLDAGTTEGGRPYFAMELVRGIPITQYSDRNSLSIRERLELFMSACRAVQHAHQKGIIHRDIKPSNVLVALYDGKPVVKVIDFGLAKALQQKLTERTMFTQYGQVVGTLEYMSPEQAEMNALDVDTRTDIYSLGVMLYELLTGSTPLQRERVRTEAFDRILQLIREEEPARPSVRLSGSGDAVPGISAQRRIEPRKLSDLLRGDLDSIAMKALDKNRTRRYETAVALAQDVERFLTDEAVEARPPSAAYRLRKTIRKHRLVFSATTLVFVALLMGMAGTTYQWIRARVAEGEARQAGKQANAFALTSKVAEQRARKAESDAIRQKQDADDQRDEATRQRNEAKELAARVEQAHEEAQQTVYQLQIGMSHNELRDGNILAAADLLKECRDDFKGWEYQHLSYRVSQLRRLPGELGVGVLLTASCYDSTGEYLAICNRESVVVYDCRSHEITRRRKLEFQPKDVVFAKDDRWLAVAGEQTIVIDVVSNETVVLIDSPAQRVQFNPTDNDVLATQSGGEVRLWHVKTGQLLQTIADSQHFAFERTGQNLIILSEGTIRRHDLKTGQSQELLAGQLRGQIASTPDGRWFAVTGSISGKPSMVTIIDRATGNRRTVVGHSNVVDAMGFSADNRWLATSSRDGTVQVVDTRTGRQERVLRGLRDHITHVAISPNGSQVLLDGMNGMLALWDLRQNPLVLDEFRTSVGQVCLSADGNLLAAAAFGEKVLLWNAVTGKRFRELPVSATFNGLALSPNGEFIATGSSNGPVIVWACESGAKLTTLPPRAPLSCIAFSRGSELLAYSRQDGQIAVYEVSSGAVRYEFPGGDGSQLVFGPNDEVLAAKVGSEVRILSLESSQTLKTFQATGDYEGSASASAARGLAFNLDGSLLAAGVNRDVVIWSVDDANEMWRLSGHGERVAAVGFDQKASRLFSASRDGTVRVWDFRAGETMLTLQSSNAATLDMAITENGRVATANTDSTVKIWSPGPSMEERIREQFGAVVQRVAKEASVTSWGPEGNKIVIGNYPHGNGLAIVDVESKDVTDLVATGKDPQWSPTGEWIAYVENRTQVWLVHPDGTQPHKLTDGYFPTWSQDGNTVFFTSSDDDNNSIRSVSVVTPETVKDVVKDANNVNSLASVSPDGRMIAAKVGDSFAVFDTDGTVLHQHAIPEWRGCLPSWSPDCKFVAFGSYGRDGKGLWVLDTVSGAASRVVKGDCTMASWSKDMSKLSFDRRATDGHDIWVMDWPPAGFAEEVESNKASAVNR